MNRGFEDHPISVAIIDDQQVLVEALKLVIAKEPDIRVVGEAGSASGCLDLLEHKNPNIVLLEINLADRSGINLIPAIKQLHPKTKIVVLTAQFTEMTLLQVLDQGASGFASKSRSLSEVMAAIRTAAAGEIAISIHLLLELLRQRVHGAPPLSKPEHGGVTRPLTKREREILTCLAQGKSGDDIAAQLDLSTQTIRTFIRNILEKLGVHSRMEAVTYALRMGLIDPMS